MIVALFVLVAACVAARFVIRRYTRNDGMANFAAISIALAFLVGSLTHPLTAPPEVPASAPPDPPAAGTDQTATAAVTPAHLDVRLPDVSAKCENVSLPTASNAQGAIDYLSADPNSPSGLPSGSTISTRIRYVLVGWAASSDRKRPARAACLFVDGKRVAGVMEHYGAPRPDVAGSFGVPALTNVGFKIVVPVGAFRSGAHDLAVAVISADRSTATIGTQTFHVEARGGS